MAYTYEALVRIAVFDIFELAFTTYMERVGFDHMSVGRLGSHSAHEFSSGSDLVSLTTSAESQSRVNIVVHSNTVPVEPLVLDALTEGVADFLKSFCEQLTDRSSEDTLQQLIIGLRDSFDRVVGADT